MRIFLSVQSYCFLMNYFVKFDMLYSIFLEYLCLNGFISALYIGLRFETLSFITFRKNAQK